MVLGQTYTSQEILELNNLFKAWLGGLFTLLPYDLPFLPYGAAMRAREQLGVKIQAAIGAARAQAAAGQPPSGILGNLVSARDEQGNRWGFGVGRFIPAGQWMHLGGSRWW